MADSAMLASVKNALGITGDAMNVQWSLSVLLL